MKMFPESGVGIVVESIVAVLDGLNLILLVFFTRKSLGVRMFYLD